jgi:hypothetical protein
MSWSKQPLLIWTFSLIRFTNIHGKRRNGKNAILIVINLADFPVSHVVSSMSARDRKILEELVRDSMLFGLSEQESMDYVQRRAVGIRISRSNFYAIKKRISQNEVDTLQQRLINHARVGYALSHFQIIDTIKGIQKILLQSLLMESSKSVEKKNLFAMSRLASSLLEKDVELRCPVHRRLQV